MYVWILTVTVLYGSFTVTVTKPGSFETKADCDNAAAKYRANSTSVVAECRAVKPINSGDAE